MLTLLPTDLCSCRGITKGLKGLCGKRGLEYFPEIKDYTLWIVVSTRKHYCQEEIRLIKTGDLISIEHKTMVYNAVRSFTSIVRNTFLFRITFKYTDVLSILLVCYQFLFLTFVSLK